MRTSANRMLGITVAAIAAIAVIVGVVTAMQSPSALDPASPEGVVQQYLSAVFEHRNDDAAKFLDASGQCDADDLDRSGFNQDAQVDLLDVVTTGTTSRVNVHLQYGGGDPFSDGWGEDKTMRLVKSGADWKITGIPWPMWDCNLVAVK